MKKKIKRSVIELIALFWRVLGICNSKGCYKKAIADIEIPYINTQRCLCHEHLIKLQEQGLGDIISVEHRKYCEVLGREYMEHQKQIAYQRIDNLHSGIKKAEELVNKARQNINREGVDKKSVQNELEEIQEFLIWLSGQ